MEEKIQYDMSAALAAILDLASAMLISGGEVGRVESTTVRLCRAYGADSADVLAITESIIVTVRGSFGVLTQTRRVSGQKYNLDRLSRLNALSRQVCAEPLPPDAFRARTEEIDDIRPGSLGLSAAVWAFTSAAFCVFFGGGLLDTVTSAVVAALLRLLQALLTERLVLNQYVSVVLCSFVGGMLAGIPSALGLTANAAAIAMGDIMLLIPGVALTNSLRDLFGGDTISGLLKFAEATILSLVIAGGFALTTTGSELHADVLPLIGIVSAFLSAAGLGLWFRTNLRTLLPGSAVAAAAWAVVVGLDAAGCPEFVCYLAAAVFVSLAAEILARVYRTPATVFLVMGIIPMVPGGLLYQTMRQGIAGQWQEFSRLGLQTLLIALAIAAGMFIVRAMADSAVQLRRRNENG